jgi:hypothetical protein
MSAGFAAMGMTFIIFHFLPPPPRFFRLVRDRRRLSHLTPVSDP